MKGNEADKLLKAKMESLDALSGGIVFGKEEAWEKLQERLQKKRWLLPPRFALTATAVLLLVVCGISIHYYTPEKQAITTEQKTIRSDVNSVAATPAAIPAVQPGKILVGSDINIKVKKAGHEKIRTIKINASPPVIETAAQIKQAQPAIAETIMPPVPQPVVVVPTPMKVVHINEVEKGSTVTEDEYVNAGPGLSLDKIPTVHINDVTREMNRLTEIRKGSRLVFRHRSGEVDINDYSTHTTLDNNEYQPTIFRRSLFNTQN